MNTRMDTRFHNIMDAIVESRNITQQHNEFMSTMLAGFLEDH